MKKMLCLLFTGILVIGTLAGCGRTQSVDVGTKDKAATTVGSSGGFYAVSLGWMENPSGQRQKQAFEAKFKEYGITNYSIVDANYDAKKQSEQIEAFIAQKPVALFLTPSDPVGIGARI